LTHNGRCDAKRMIGDFKLCFPLNDRFPASC
jgi:hypothetical protein